MTQPLISICIATLYKRAGLLARLLRELHNQIEETAASELVELLVEPDDGQMTTGAKRNKLYAEAKGKYVCSVDDDDWISRWYILELLRAAVFDHDAIAMNGTMTTNGRNEQKWFISKDLPYTSAFDQRRQTVFLRYHNHISCIRREIALQCPFPDKSMHEDSDFALAIHKSGLIKTEAIIGTSWPTFMNDRNCRAELPMYKYLFSSIK